MSWLTVAEAAKESKRHPRTVADACRAGELHGSQRARNASWRIEDSCLDAWIRGVACIHHQANVTPIRRRSA